MAQPVRVMLRGIIDWVTTANAEGPKSPPQIAKAVVDQRRKSQFWQQSAERLFELRIQAIGSKLPKALFFFPPRTKPWFHSFSGKRPAAYR
jgi:hypothetical protein